MPLALQSLDFDSPSGKRFVLKMYKFTNTIRNSNLVLVRKQFGDRSCAALIVMRAPVRRYAKDHYHETCPPPSKLSIAKRMPWKLIGATVVTASAIIYAKSSRETRSWLESNAPWADNIVALVYEENTTHRQFTMNQINKISKFVNEFLFGEEGITPMEYQKRSEQDLEKDAELGFAIKDYTLPPPMLESLYVEDTTIATPEVDTPATLVQTDKCDPQPPVTVKITKDLVTLEHEMHENTKVAIDNFKAAVSLCTNYNKALFNIVELPLQSLAKKHFTQLQSFRTERDKVIKKAEDASSKAKAAIGSLDRMINSSTVAAPPETVAMMARHIKQFRADLTTAEEACKVEFEKAAISDKYWSKVEAARAMYKDELELLFPGIDMCARQLDVKGDTDLFLLYTLKQVQLLQNALAEMQTVRELKLNRAINCNDEKLLIEAKVEDIIAKEKLEKQLEFEKQALGVRAETNRTTKEQLKKQMEIQQEVLADKLKKKEIELQARLNRVVSENVEKERILYKKELAAMAGKLKAIEETMRQRAKAEKDARKSQSLWAAAEALLTATRRPGTETKIENELKALEKAGSDDPLVQAIMKGIPSEVRDKGIVTEGTLRDGFEKMEKTALKVALIGREGASLPVYFLSWLQSLVLFQKFSEIPSDELENMPTDFTQLDTFDIIQRARYYMDQGNLGIALRYVNLLQGAPRAAARCWVDAARRHLEIKQAAETVMAHASLSGLLDS